LTNHDLLESVDFARIKAFDAIPETARSKMGQFGTPAPIARLLASMFTFGEPLVRLLDAGAGVGSLTAAFVTAACEADRAPKTISVTAYEVEPLLVEHLRDAMARCGEKCTEHGIEFNHVIIEEDFIEAITSSGGSTLFSPGIHSTYNFAIQNPPYHKIRSNSNHRKWLSDMDIEVPNIYAGFVALTVRLLEPGGQLVAITPRSFCNGPYFQSFREDFLHRMSIKRLHVFDNRNKAFGGDKVLQENVIISAITGARRDDVLVTSSSGEQGSDELQRRVTYDRVVPPGRPVPFIHLITDGAADLIDREMNRFESTLEDIGLDISTGRVIDFRAKEYLRQDPGPDDFPLIYPVHLKNGVTCWPLLESKKPNALARLPGVEKLLVPPGMYVLIKRFSAKEQRRRVEAAIYDSSVVALGMDVGFENHVNYIHKNNRGLESNLALGLAVYLNSSVVDLYFRLFSGHTQVNATDLRGFPFPTRDELVRLGRKAGSVALSQEQVDELVAREIPLPNGWEGANPVALNKKIEESRQILKELGFPSEQTNERSALVLLALLGLKPDTPWSQASSPLLGITEIMDYFAEQYGRRYAPNTRETIRRRTVHQFLDAGLLVQNPDDPSRPVNSAKNVYQVIPEALAILQTFGADRWEDAKQTYMADIETLREIYAQKRKMERLPVRISGSTKLSLSPGGQNILVKQVIDEFLPRFVPGALLIYVGDTEDKWAHFDEDAFAKLGIQFDSHGKFPDVVVHYPDKDWLLLVEAVTSHGPVNPKRHRELKNLFEGASAGLVFVTTFLTRKDLVKFINEIAWETEVWVAESPEHMIHFDGTRFLGPYPE